jgi:hypothetical protein
MRPFDSGQDAQYGLPSTYHSRMVSKWLKAVHGKTHPAETGKKS